MSKRKGKFDLTRLVHEGFIKDGQTFYFVSNPAMSFQVKKQPNNEFKIFTGETTTTVHAFAVQCLGMEPPEHASRWFRDDKGATMYQLWQACEEARDAA